MTAVFEIGGDQKASHLTEDYDHLRLTGREKKSDYLLARTSSMQPCNQSPIHAIQCKGSLLQT